MGSYLGSRNICFSSPGGCRGRSGEKDMAHPYPTGFVELGRTPWIRWIWHLIYAFVVVIPVIAFFRLYPEFLHNYAKQIPAGILLVFHVLVWSILTLLFCQFFRPRISHFKYLKTNPPVWIAWVISLFLVWISDGFGWWDTRSVNPIGWEYGGVYGGILLGIFSWCGLTGAFPSTGETSSKRQPAPSSPPEQWDWPVLERWLLEDAPAEKDMLGDRWVVAERLAQIIRSGTRSVAILGPYGSGKTTLVHWIEQALSPPASPSDSPDTGAANSPSLPRFLFCKHSCWGFKSSEECVYELLQSALEKLNLYTDTFSVAGIPKAYRRALFAGRDWLEVLLEPFLGTEDWQDQFRRLSELLERVGIHLVFVIEDLDRADGPQFHITEVTGFLAQLKQLREVKNISYILTQDPGATNRIDVARLADHIEILHPIRAETVMEIIRLVREKCMKQYPIHPISQPEPVSWTRLWEIPVHIMLWQERSSFYMLWDTPRVVRRILGRTYRSWQVLAGEVDWDSLLGLNVLRERVPDAFNFLLRWQNILFMDVHHLGGDYSTRKKEVKADWEKTKKALGPLAEAVGPLIAFLLPTAQGWLDIQAPFGSLQRPQGVGNLRYWYRAINERIPPDEIRDQEVIQEIEHYVLGTPLKSTSSSEPKATEKRKPQLGEKILKTEGYVKVFNQWIGEFICHQYPSPQQIDWRWLKNLIEEMIAHISEVEEEKIDVPLERFAVATQKLARIHFELTVQWHRNPLAHLLVSLVKDESFKLVAETLRSAIEAGSPRAAIVFAQVYLTEQNYQDAVLQVFGKVECQKIVEIIEAILPQMREDFREAVKKILEDFKKKLEGFPEDMQPRNSADSADGAPEGPETPPGS